MNPSYEDSQSLVIKEVYVLFMIFDYLPFPDLIRSSQVSRGLYWLSGNQLLLFKFQNHKPILSLSKQLGASPQHLSKQRQLLQQRIKRSRQVGHGIFSKEFVQFKRQMDSRFLAVYRVRLQKHIDEMQN